MKIVDKIYKVVVDNTYKQIHRADSDLAGIRKKVKLAAFSLHNKEVLHYQAQDKWCKI